VALTQRHIEHLVKNRDPLLDREYVLLALDQMLGHPPYIAPKLIRDRYNRLGNIIYNNGYYVY